MAYAVNYQLQVRWIYLLESFWFNEHDYKNISSVSGAGDLKEGSEP